MTPVNIFPWQRPFLPDLKDFLQTLSRGRPGRVLLLLPNNRPARYLARLYAASGHTGPLPRIMALEDAVAAWRAWSSDTPLHMAGELDRVAVLRQCVAGLARDDARLAARFAPMDMARFLPWGLRLAALLEELLAQDVAAADLAHAEAEVAAPAAALLGALGRIGRAYVAELSRRGWTTPGLDAHAVAHHAGEIPPFFRPGPERPVVMAGFALLNGCSETLLRRLWQAGGQVCLHADPALAGPSGWHWSCNILADWLRRWQAKAQLAVMPTAEELARRPRMRFFAGYDAHSQLAALREELASAADTADSTAIALTNNGLLLPVLHHLPARDVNISMGYPLERSPLNHLLETLLQLHEHKAGDGRLHWRALLRCLRHPYLNLLCADDGGGGSLPLRTTLRKLEAGIRRGARFVDWDALVEETCGDEPAPLRALLDQCRDILLNRPGMAGTTGEMAGCLTDICHFLLRHGGDMWQRFPLDAEAMYRLARHAAPQLRQTCLAGTPFPLPTLHGIVRELLRQERVPFEAEPLTGLQVMGMLETRLLHFARVHILDATDDNLPGHPAQDALLPDSLRNALGLPDALGRERATAYNLYRLCAGAGEVLFYWQEGIARSTLFDGKKSRSRFVEQLVWEEEQRRGALLDPGRDPLRAARCTVRSAPTERRELPRTAALDAAMRTLLAGRLSATRLDAYQQCPLRFVWQQLCRLSPPAEVNEGDDPAAVGTCIHRTLHSLFKPWEGRELRRGDISREHLEACFHAALEASGLRRLLPPDSCLMLEESAPVRLMRLLENLPERTRIVALERQLDATLSLAGHAYAFTGILDRVDARDGLLHILDYKTGHLKLHEGGLWTDIAFFKSAAALCQALDASGAPDAGALRELDAIFEELRLRLPSLQLPCYLAMAEASGLGHLADAALVELRGDGREHPLFGGLAGTDLRDALRYCSLALSVTLLHMRHAPVFAPRPGDGCAWCPYGTLCLR